MTDAPATRSTGRWRARLGGLSIRHQLLALFGLFLLAGATVLVIDEVAQYHARQSLLALKDDSLLRMRRLKAVSDAYGLDVVDTTFRVRNNLITWQDGVAVVDDANARIARDWSALKAMPRSTAQQRLFAEVEAHRSVADAAMGRWAGDWETLTEPGDDLDAATLQTDRFRAREWTWAR